jgi:ABC-type antimicrobial peptide transport system permease subunit
MALGATPASVRGAVLKRGIAVSAVGLVVGLAAVAPLRALARPLLYGITPTDPLTIISVSVVLLGVGAVATWLPARRAAKLDPVRAFKCE